MEKLSLNDGRWQFRQAGRRQWLPATVPGCVHTDLLAAGKIADPFYRDNELTVQWIAETDWTYRRDFELTDEFLAHDRVLLRCAGLDTLATLRLNGQEVGRADNMFRTWEFDLKPALRPGANRLEIDFAAPLPYLRQRDEERQLPAWGTGDWRLHGAGWLRKAPYQFGWDWGPKLATSGLWREVHVVAFNTARLSAVHVQQDHSKRRAVGLSVDVTADRIGRVPLRAEVRVSLDGELVSSGAATLKGKSGTVDCRIANPQLWWPNGMGDRPLYDLEVALTTTEGEVLDTATQRLGLRTLTLERHGDKWGESFHFAVNGVPFFAKGANWIPADSFPSRLIRADYFRLLRDAAEANMNMLRVWGGGLYESDEFYDLCDELGLCVWQDFMFACATYPAFDSKWLSNVRAEAEDNVRRLRHHACLALWCGNNELEQGLVGGKWAAGQMSWKDYSTLFDKLLRDVVRKLDGDRPYWPGSSHSPHGDRGDWKNPDWGDAHLWDVWHGGEPVEWYRSTGHRFVSEFGFQSFPAPKTVASYTRPSDRNLTSWVMEHHQRHASGNAKIMHYLLDWFRLPTSFGMLLRTSQLLQGVILRYAVEHWRRQRPRTMGALYWQLNDCWPVASWASLDFFGRWKASHYLAKRFFAPLLVSGVEDVDRGTVEIHVTNDRRDRCEGEVCWWVTDLSGRVVTEGTKAVRVAAGASRRVQTLRLKRQLEEFGPRNLLAWLQLTVGGKRRAVNFVSFAKPKHLELQAPKLTRTIRQLNPHSFRVSLTAERPALWTWLEVRDVEARFTNNYVHIRPGESVSLRVHCDRELTEKEFRQRLRVRSLIDTYR